jgi:hypothetical protein
MTSYWNNHGGLGNPPSMVAIAAGNEKTLQKRMTREYLWFVYLVTLVTLDGYVKLKNKGCEYEI